MGRHDPAPVPAPSARRAGHWWWLPWLLGTAAAIVLATVVVVVVSRDTETDGERACALVGRPAREAFGQSARAHPGEGDCTVATRDEVIVAHVYGDPVGAGHYRASRRAVEESDPSVRDAPVQGGRAFFADRGTTLWVWDPESRIEFALFASGPGSSPLVDLANAVLAASR